MRLWDLVEAPPLFSPGNYISKTVKVALKASEQDALDLQTNYVRLFKKTSNVIVRGCMHQGIISSSGVRE